MALVSYTSHADSLNPMDPYQQPANSAAGKRHDFPAS
jgi:hypothetical protein